MVFMYRKRLMPEEIMGMGDSKPFKYERGRRDGRMKCVCGSGKMYKKCCLDRRKKS